MTCVDLGNLENIKNRNRIYDEGLYALIEGIYKSQSVLISELHLKQASISGYGLQALAMLENSSLQVLDLANNDLGNEGANYLKYVMQNLISLNLANTKMGLRGCSDLCKTITNDNRLRFLDL